MYKGLLGKTVGSRALVPRVYLPTGQFLCHYESKG